MSKLKCVMFCEFDPHLGPQIAYQAPEDYISKGQMDSIAPYIITKPQLQSRLISLKAFGYNFMGFPVIIEDKKYNRNALLFNTVFVFNEDDQVKEYEPVVKKLAGYLRTLELEISYLSEEKTKSNIPDMLKKILCDLSCTGECNIPIDSCNTIYLKVVKLPKEPPVVLDHQVPIFSWSKKAVESQHWDLTAQHVMPYIDGLNHVQKISSLADVDLGLVRSAIQTLLFHGVVALMPVFLYSNMYAIKPEINILPNDEDMQEECVSYVARDKNELPNFRDVFMLYCAFGPGISVNALCSRHDPASLGINEVKLIQYGLIKKFIHKLNKYPVLLTSDYNYCKWVSGSRWLNGYHNYAEICCKAADAGETLQYEDIDKKTENDPYVVHIWK